MCCRGSALVMLLAGITCSAAELTTLKGQKITGTVVSIDDAAVVVQTGTADASIPADQVLRLQLTPEPAVTFPTKFVDVELIDGSIFHCKEFTLKGKTLEMVVLPNRVVRVPLTSVAYILMDAQDPKTQKEWQEIFADRGRRDRFFLRKDDRLDGLEGTFGEASADGKTIEFEMATGGKRNLPIDRLVGLLFNNRLEGKIPQTVCRVIDSYKSTLVAAKVQLKQGKLTVTTVAGLPFEFSTLEPLVALDYGKDKIVYLSDLKFKEENPSAEQVVRCARDMNLENRPIELDNQAFAKGLVVHGDMRLTFDLGGEFKEFQTVLGLDPLAKNQGNVKVVFEGDGRVIYSAEVKLDEKPQPVTLDVKKVRQFRVIVTPAVTSGLPFRGGHDVTLADAKVTK